MQKPSNILHEQVILRECLSASTLEYGLCSCVVMWATIILRLEYVAVPRIAFSYLITVLSSRVVI
jgi:hypothetical protein